MRALTPAQIAAHVRAAGFPEELVPTKVAIAMAESSGNPKAHNPNASTGDDSYGIFQVNMRGAMGPERRRQFGLQSNEQLFDPAINAQAAKKIFDSQGLNAWSVHKSGAYKQFMPEAQQAARASSSAAPAAPFAGPAGGVGSTPAGPSLDDLAAQILSGGGGFRMASPSSMAPQAAAPMARTPGELAGTMLDASFARAAGQLGGRRMAASDALLPGLFQAATGVPVESIASMMPSVAGQTGLGVTGTPAAPASAGEMVDMIKLGTMLQDQGKLRVREHSAFGGVGQHSQGSRHYKDEAFDLTDWKDPGEGQSSWLPRKKYLEERFSKILGPAGEIYGPVSDPGGHGTHIHLGVPGGRLPLSTAQQLVQARLESLQKYPLRWAG